MWSWCLCLHGPGRRRNGSLARLKLPTRLQAQAPRSHSKVKVEERAAQKPAEWVFSRDSALRLVDDAKRFFFDTKVFGGLDIDMIYFSLRAACFQ